MKSLVKRTCAPPSAIALPMDRTSSHPLKGKKMFNPHLISSPGLPSEAANKDAYKSFCGDFILFMSSIVTTRSFYAGYSTAGINDLEGKGTVPYQQSPKVFTLQEFCFYVLLPLIENPLMSLSFKRLCLKL